MATLLPDLSKLSLGPKPAPVGVTPEEEEEEVRRLLRRFYGPDGDMHEAIASEARADLHQYYEEDLFGDAEEFKESAVVQMVLENLNVMKSSIGSSDRMRDQMLDYLRPLVEREYDRYWASRNDPSDLDEYQLMLYDEVDEFSALRNNRQIVDSGETYRTDMADRRQMARVDPAAAQNVPLLELNEDVKQRVVDWLSNGDFESVCSDLKAFCDTSKDGFYFCRERMETDGSWRKLLVVFGLPPYQIKHLPERPDPFPSWFVLWITLCRVFGLFTDLDYQGLDSVAERRANMTGRTDWRDQLLDPKTPPLYKAAAEEKLRGLYEGVGGTAPGTLALADVFTGPDILDFEVRGQRAIRPEDQALLILLGPAKKAIDDYYGVEDYSAAQLNAGHGFPTIATRTTNYTDLLNAICSLDYTRQEMPGPGLGNPVDWSMDLAEVQWAADVVSDDDLFGDATYGPMSASVVVNYLVKKIGVHDIGTAITRLVSELRTLKTMMPFDGPIQPSDNSFFTYPFRHSEILSIFDILINAALDQKYPGVIRAVAIIGAVEFMTIPQRIRWRKQILVAPNTPPFLLDYETDTLTGNPVDPAGIDPLGDATGPGVLDAFPSIRERSALKNEVGRILLDNDPDDRWGNLALAQVMRILRGRYGDVQNQFQTVRFGEFDNYTRDIRAFVREQRVAIARQRLINPSAASGSAPAGWRRRRRRR